MPTTGNKLWRLYTTAAQGEKGGDTWPGDTAQKGGAPTWLTGAYDADLDLVYWGTGNGGPWNAAGPQGRQPVRRARCSRSGPKTGELVWHYQFSAQRSRSTTTRTEVGMLVDLNDRRRHAQGAGAGQPQRLLLRARPRQRQAARGQPVRQGELGRQDRHGHRQAGRIGGDQARARRRRRGDLAVGARRQELDSRCRGIRRPVWPTRTR